MEDSTELTRPFLGGENKPVVTYSHQSGWLKNRISIGASILSLLLLFHISIIASLELYLKHGSTKLNGPYSPANKIIRYEQKYNWGGHSEFIGPPSANVDKAWRDLLLGLNVRGTKEELLRGGENLTNIAQLEDGDYVVVPLVYHHIHCLDSIRKYFYIDYYRSIAGPDDSTNIEEEHFDHCVENLRKQVMCHADLSMLTGEWIAPPETPDHFKLRTKSRSLCVNWDAIQSWAMSRFLKQGEYKLRAGPFQPQDI